MLSLEDKSNILELLSGLSLDDIMSLSSTITKGLLKPTTREEANEAIIQHSDSVDSVLNRQKVTKELIFNYLNWKKVHTDNYRDKKSLMSLLTNFWNKSTTTSIQPNINSQNQGSTVSNAVGLESGQVDLLAFKFVEWFYQLLNWDFLQGGDFALTPSAFWNDASLQMKINSNEEEILEVAHSSEAVVNLLNETKHKFKFYFSPNLSSEGVRGKTEPHGMVSVLVCGTLHQAAGVVVGLFEQTFSMMKDPLSNYSWKVKGSQLHLTSQSNVSGLPTLSQGSLTAALLPIANPD